MVEISNTSPLANTMPISAGSESVMPSQGSVPDGGFEGKLAQFLVPKEMQDRVMNDEPYMTRSEWTTRLQQRVDKRNVEVGLIDMSTLRLRQQPGTGHLSIVFSDKSEASIAAMVENLKENGLIADGGVIELPKSTVVMGFRKDANGKQQQVIVEQATTLGDQQLTYLYNIGKEYGVKFNLKTQPLVNSEY